MAGVRKKRVMVVMGTRPEAIKLSPLIHALQEHSDVIDVVVTLSGQHRDMLDQVLEVFSIEASHDLDVMQERQTLFHVTTTVLTRIESVMKQEALDLVIVQGDTTTAMTAALAAFYLRIPVAHVEAGLRTGDRMNPYPEETNRRLISQLADWHFAPTTWARDNLLHEGLPPESIYVTGNTVIDALLCVAKRDFSFSTPELQSLDFENQRVILVTLHRRENWGAPVESVCLALKTILANCPDVTLVFSVHKNPEVRDVIYREMQGNDRVLLVEPLDYQAFVHLMAASHLILTDSGGIQEEAPSLGKPVLVMRSTTERPEGIEAGTLKLVGTQSKAIVQSTMELLESPAQYREMSAISNPYGDGKSSARIALHVLQILGTA
jgi:UDP-N-acetylglucosamine 2-epimerase (non-hydrolysing)